MQFYFNPGGSLYYDQVMFEPLPSFLSFYGNMILAGELDHLPEQAFYLVGSIEEVKAKAEKIESEAKA